MGQELVIWTPTADETHLISYEGIDNVEITPTDGGRIIKALTAEVGEYRIQIDDDG